MQDKKWEPCPRCGSNRTQSRGGCFMAIMGLGIMSIGLWVMLIPVLGWIAGPLLLLIGLVILIASPLAKMTCNARTAYTAGNIRTRKTRQRVRNYQSQPVSPSSRCPLFRHRLGARCYRLLCTP